MPFSFAFSDLNFRIFFRLSTFTDLILAIRFNFLKTHLFCVIPFYYIVSDHQAISFRHYSILFISVFYWHAVIQFYSLFTASKDIFKKKQNE